MFAGIQSLQGNLGIRHLMKMTRSSNPRRVSLERSKADFPWKSTVTVSTRHVNSRRDSNDARYVSLLCFYPQCLTFQSPLSTCRKMAASIKSLNLNFKKSKTIPVTGHLILLTQLLPLQSLHQVFLSSAVDFHLPSAEVAAGQARSPSALYHFLCKQPHLKSYLTSSNSSKESLFPKEATSHAPEIASSFPWSLNPSKSVLFSLCCDV